MSQLTLVIGNKNYSSWSLRPWFFMQQMGLKFEEIRIPLGTKTTDQQLLNYGSDRKVPVLIDDDLTVWDSLAILEYLSENYCAGKGWPEDKAQRAIARSISAEMHSSFFNLRGEMPMNCRKDTSHVSLSAAAHEEIQRVITLWRDCRKQHDSPWLFEQFSIADAMFAPVVMRFNGFGIALEGSEKEYVSNILNQPCIKDWLSAAQSESEVMQDYEL